MAKLRGEQLAGDLEITSSLKVDDITLNGETISTPTDTNLTFSPGGAGSSNSTKYIGINIDDTVVDSATNMMVMYHSVTGTPAAGIGVNTIGYTESLGGPVKQLYEINVTFTNVTDGSEDAKYDIDLMTNGSVINALSLTGILASLNGYLLQTGIFGEIYFADASTAQSIPTGATYTKITAFTTNGENSNCTADAINDKITITKEGRYKVSGAFSGQSGTANVTFRGTTFLNGVEQSQIHFKRKFSTAADSGSMSFSGFIDVTTAPLDLDFRVRHDNGGSINLTLEYGNLNVEYIGKT